MAIGSMKGSGKGAKNTNSTRNKNAHFNRNGKPGGVPAQHHREPSRGMPKDTQRAK